MLKKLLNRWVSNDFVNVRIKLSFYVRKVGHKKRLKRAVYYRKRSQDTIESILGPLLFVKKLR